MIDIKTLKKDEIVRMAKWKCPYPGHSKHNGLEHPVCYEKDVKGKYKENTLFFDIEAEDLNADYGIMFNWYAIDDEGNTFEDFITIEDIKKWKSQKRDVEPKEDTRIVKSLSELISKYTRIVGHYACGYDIPFTRTRAVIDGVDFPGYGMVFQSDTWVFLKKKFKLSRNSLVNGCKKLVGHTRKDQLSLAIKHGCLRGEKWAIDDSRKHCKQDVEDLVELYEKTQKYSRKTNGSI